MKEKTKGLLVDAGVYLLAFGAGIIPFVYIENVLLAVAALTAVATAVIFVFSTALSDVSVYDPYWSVAPVVILFVVFR